jgi:hypothetical protein
MSLKTIYLGIAVLALGAFFVACDEPVGDYRTETRSVALDGATRAEVGLHMGAGRLRVRGADQANLLEGSFEFNRDRFRPEIDYRSYDGKGILHVRHARRSNISFGRVRNRWDLGLTTSVPLDLSIDLGAGESDLDLRGLKLERLEIDMGVGETKLDLRGPRTESFRVKIDGGVGSGTIYLPAEVGVRVKVDGGLGSVNGHGLTKSGGAWTNEAYGKSPVTIEVDIDAGIGSLDLRCESSDPIKI